MEAFVTWTVRMVICAVGMAVVGALMAPRCLIFERSLAVDGANVFLTSEMASAASEIYKGD